jgi:pimeloyl-ACP methyl ester carboxylesterase
LNFPPIVLIPGLLGSPRLYAEQIPALWQLAPVTIASHRDGDSMATIAGQILATAPPQFTIIGLSMGGYVAFEIMRQAAARVTGLALLDTTARPDTIEQNHRRHEQIAQVQSGQLAEVTDALFRRWVPAARHTDEPLHHIVRQMAAETGPDAFVRQQTAIMNRPDSRPNLDAITCPTLVLVGADDTQTTPEHATEIADAISGAHLMVVPDCGHLSTIEQPATITAALVAWLDQHHS